MRYIFILLISCFLFSCNFNQSKNNDVKPISEKDSTVDPEKLALMKLTNPNDYRQVLDKLDAGDLASLNLASTLFKNSLVDTLMRDSMFVVLNEFYTNIAGNYLENNEVVNTQLENSSSAETINKLKASLSSYGMNLSSAEGTFYLEPQTDYLLRNYGAELSPAYREYLTISSK